MALPEDEVWAARQGCRLLEELGDDASEEKTVKYFRTLAMHLSDVASAMERSIAQSHSAIPKGRLYIAHELKKDPDAGKIVAAASMAYLWNRTYETVAVGWTKFKKCSKQENWHRAQGVHTATERVRKRPLFVEVPLNIMGRAVEEDRHRALTKRSLPGCSAQKLLEKFLFTEIVAYNIKGARNGPERRISLSQIEEARRARAALTVD